MSTWALMVNGVHSIILSSLVRLGFSGLLLLYSGGAVRGCRRSIMIIDSVMLSDVFLKLTSHHHVTEVDHGVYTARTFRSRTTTSELCYR